MSNRMLHYCVGKENQEYYMFVVGEHNMTAEVTNSIMMSGLCIAATELPTDPPSMRVGGFSIEDLGTLLKFEGATPDSFDKAREAGIVHTSPPIITGEGLLTKDYRRLTEDEVSQLKFCLR